MPGGPTMPALSNSEGTAASFFAVVANGLRRPMRVTLLLTLMFAFAAVRAFAQGKAPPQPAGNPEHGKELFNGGFGCSTCHMIEGKGGRLGPDLTTVGASRSTEYLVESVRNPSRQLAQGILEAMKEFPQEYESVLVVTADGTKLSGVVLNQDQFTLQMLDTREQLHLFEKDKLRSLETRRESAMPVYDQKALSDKDLQDLLAYLLEVAGT